MNQMFDRGMNGRGIEQMRGHTARGGISDGERIEPASPSEIREHDGREQSPVTRPVYPVRSVDQLKGMIGGCAACDRFFNLASDFDAQQCLFSEIVRIHIGNNITRIVLYSDFLISTKFLEWFAENELAHFAA